MSKAVIDYSQHTLEELFCCYAQSSGMSFLAGANAEKVRIRSEIMVRVSNALYALDQAGSYEDGEAILDKFLKGRF